MASASNDRGGENSADRGRRRPRRACAMRIATAVTAGMGLIAASPGDRASASLSVEANVVRPARLSSSSTGDLLPAATLEAANVSRSEGAVARYRGRTSAGPDQETARAVLFVTVSVWPL